ncbi:MAG: EAL domain-containing protein [Gammaproteobacteria bacterium]
MSCLLAALSAGFYWLSDFHLMRQYHAQRVAEVQAFRRQMSGLFAGISDRLVRLGGTIVSMGTVVETFKRGNPGKNLPAATAARFAGLGYEMDVQRIELYSTGGERLWRWTPAEAPDLPEERLRAALAQVHAEERPATFLWCEPLCLLHAFVPVLAEGQDIGVMGLGQSIADLVIEFRALTGTDIAIVVPAAGNGGTLLHRWASAVPALTNVVRLSPFMEELSAKYPDPAELDSGRLLQSRGTSFEVQRFPLAEFIPTEPGFILFISDVSARLAEIERATRRGLLTAAGALAVGELLLLYLVRVLSGRLRWFAQTLPLLAQGQHRAARGRLAEQQKATSSRDEIDLLYDTALTLSHQLEESSQALSAKNRELAQERDLMQGVLDAAQVLVVTQNRHGIIQMANKFASQVTGFSTVKLQGRRFVDLIADVEAHQEVLSKLDNLYARGQRRADHEHDLVGRDGTRHQVLWVHTRLHGEHTDDAAVVSVGLDVSERVEAEQRMRWLANHDTLTGLCNRHRFLEDLTRTYDEVARTRVTGALLLFDLDHFKEVNDTSGHAAGDALLRMIGEELNSRARKSDVVARLGGDEFAVLLPNTDASGAETFAHQFNERLAETPFVHSDKRYHIKASIGIALLPDHGLNVEEIMANADAAMYEAKRAGRGRAAVFAYEDDQALAQGIYWKNVLTRALAESHILFDYQPVSDTATGVTAHHEALLRLRMADGRVAFPGEFLPAAQRSGLNSEIDYAVVRAALDVLRADPTLRLSINLSAAVWNDTRWVESLVQAARTQRMDPVRLILEVTETVVVTDLAKAKSIMEKITGHGFCFAMDDAGTGFNTSNYLKDLPITYIKLDLSLVKGLATDTRVRNFVRAITMMVHEYGKKVVGKGIEDTATLALLKGMGVDFVQGFYLGRPADAPSNRSLGAGLEDATDTGGNEALDEEDRVRGASL